MTEGEAAQAVPAHAALPRWRDRQAWLKTADVFAILTVATLPWSTSLPSICAAIWILVLLPAIEWRDFLRLLRDPACWLPVALFALAVVGMLWSIAPWNERLHGVNPVGKLLMLPLIIYHFRQSPRGPWVFGTFLVSCTLLMLLSWLSAYDFRFVIKAEGAIPGVPVKNSIAQSQDFVLCVAGLAWLLLAMLRRRRLWLALLFAVVALGFVLNMMFVVVARTALITLPVLLGVLFLLYLKPRALLLAAVATVAAVALLWATSPNFRSQLTRIASEAAEYRTSETVTSAGLRLEYWRKSLRFFAEAPLIGHGTGATRTLFVGAAEGQSGIRAEVIGNPHNQTLYVAVQWGTLGVVLLWLMWLRHLLLFRGPPPGQELAAWIGLAVVLQNIASSLFNSHLFDFHEGWMYIIGVGIAGGMMLQTGSRAARNARCKVPAAYPN
ncbi:MAG: O-antigen ligase family protein [Xanthobacteraceae bacterium]